MPARAKRRHAAEERWTPSRPVPWPDTGDLHLDLLRAAVEARLYPYGDLVSSPGRYVSSYQLSLLERGRVEGMDDRQVSAFLSTNLMCGGNSVYRNRGVAPEWMGTVGFAGRWDPPDAMGRRAFYWTLSVEPRPGEVAGDEKVRWERGAVCDAFRRAFGVPAREFPPEEPVERWEDGQGLLF